MINAFVSVLILSGCGETTNSPIVSDIRNVQIEPFAQKLYPTTDSLQLHSSVVFDDGTTESITDKVTWSFENDTFYKYATIFGGEVQPIANGAEGNATVLPIRIDYRGLSDTASLDFIAAKSVTINDSDINDRNNIVADRNYTLYADVNYSDGNYSAALGNNSKNIRWSVEGNVTIVHSSEGNLTVSFAKGEANITCFLFDLNDTRSYTIK